MVKVTMPMGGFSASGSIGGALTFATTKGRQYARQLVTPSNPNSASQKATRAMMRFLSQAWANLTAPEQASWESLTSADNISPFNAFVRYDMNLWTQFDTPFKDPAATGETVPVMGALTMTGGIRQASGSQVITTANDIWGMLIALSTTTGFTPSKTDIVLVREQTASPITFVLTGLTPGDYFVRTAGFTGDGQVTAFIAQVPVTVS
jgi:hypothetical protein